MTDEVPDNATTDVTISPGKILSDGRKQAGLTPQQVADKLFLKVSVIEDLESDKIDDTKSLTFSKGYVKNYAKLLGLNAEQVITAFESFHNKPQETAKLQSFSKRVAKQAQDDRWMMVTYALLVLLIAAIVIWWYQQPRDAVGSTVAEPEPRQQASQVANQQAGQDKEWLEIDGQEDNQEVQPLVAAPDTQDSESTESSPEAVSNEANELPQAQAESDANPPPEVEESNLAQLVFTFAEDCWVNITDATGEAIAYGVKAAGREMALEGQPPFQITLGAPQVVQITYNGEPVDMSEFTGREIGRLTLPRQE